MASTLILLVIGLPWIGALLVWWIGDKRSALQHALAIAFSVASGAAAVALIFNASASTVISLDAGGVFGQFTFVADGLGVYLAAIATVIGSLAVIFSVNYMHGEKGLGRYYAMVLFFIGGMAGLVLTSNLLLMFLFWEITALCSYALIAFNNDDPKAVAGGIKALIITQLGGIGLLAGALILYSQTGSYDFNQMIANPGLINPQLLAGMAFGCLIAAAAKSAQFPFFTWLPDAMEAPTPISALIHAATMVNAGVYLLARFFPAFEAVPGWKTSVIIVGMVSAFISAIMALFAYDLKRVLAYSTISQLGYMVFAIGCGGIYASQFHLFSHSIFKALLFLSAGAIIHSVGTRDMREMGGLGKKMPFTRVVFIIGALALAGIPILNGFWSKELVLEAGLTNGPVWAYIIMLITAGLTAFYTFRMVWMVFFGKPSEKHVHDAQPAMKVALAPLALGAVVAWLLAGPFASMLQSTLPAHNIHALSTIEIMMEVIKAPATYIALAVVALGLVAWWQRKNLTGIGKAFHWLGYAANNSFGFEAVNKFIVRETQAVAEELRDTQTGLLNWNIAGLLIGLIAVIIILVMGG